MGDGLLTTGEFARRSRLSVKALRLYDRSGLLRPAEVHAGNGYRRYAEHQLYAARLIVLLRRLDMPLSQITEILAAGGPGAGELLARYWTDVERRLAAQRELADRLVRSLSGETPAQAWPVQQREVPEQLVLTEQRYVTAAELSWIRSAGARLTAVAQRHGGPAGPRFVVFHGEVTEDSDGPVEVCVPVDPAAVDPAEVAVRVEPAHREAFVPVVRGHFEPPQILSIYDAARRWIRDRGLAVTAPAREVYGYGADVSHGAADDLVCDVAVPYA
ncbi:MerR family transcriptional regulator [Actinoplanes friuliensis]|uniref:Putative MerR family transcriptional regulator n=1 Tax=Actinoplanes friuliensis DSM 7358 TaxID=1246995 RepID=U5W5A7_9ACTN|nr:MerR family transcriptional regulator [Actinoplanes friuliensis]AGZ43165.1 putative MerR family transcriptional regulator [Actinoplanes friuliensis DSM 7358]